MYTFQSPLLGYKTTNKGRNINDIATDFYQTGSPIPAEAKPFLRGLQCLSNTTDSYQNQTATEWARKFLKATIDWRNDKAKALRTELKKLLQIP